MLDLDPGAPASVVECAEVALLLKDLVEADGLEPLAKTSGSKGMQVSAAVKPASDERTSAYAHELAKRLEKERPDLVVSRMAKNLRGGKVFVDWSQNNAAKTTVAPYALRARPQPWVSTPVTWDEVAACRKPADLQFRADQALERVEAARRPVGAAPGDGQAAALRPVDRARCGGSPGPTLPPAGVGGGREGGAPVTVRFDSTGVDDAAGRLARRLETARALVAAAARAEGGLATSSWRSRRPRSPTWPGTRPSWSRWTWRCWSVACGPAPGCWSRPSSTWPAGPGG